jgi:hypothetical protein
MAVFTFETNAPPNSVPAWAVECESAVEAKKQALVMFGQIVASEAYRLVDGGLLCLSVSNREGRVLLKLQMTSADSQSQPAGTPF